MEPYKAMFGTSPKVGLTTSNLPQDLVKTLSTEEVLLSLQTSVSTPELSVNHPVEPVINQVSPSSLDDLLPTSDGTISTSLAADFLEPDLFVPSNVDAAPIPPDHVLHPETSLSTSNLTLNTPEVAINEEESAALEADVQIRCEMIKTSRKRALDAIEEQAHKMLKRSNVQLSDANHGTFFYTKDNDLNLCFLIQQVSRMAFSFLFLNVFLDIWYKVLR